MWKNGQHAAIMKYGDLLPDELIKKNADFCLYYAWILIIAGQIQKAEPFLVSAEKITRQIINDKNSSKEDVQYNKKLSGKISVAFAYLYSLMADIPRRFMIIAKQPWKTFRRMIRCGIAGDGTQLELQKWLVDILMKVLRLLKKLWLMARNRATSILFRQLSIIWLPLKCEWRFILLLTRNVLTL